MPTIVVTKLDPVVPSAGNTPFTNGAKHAKSKIKWGTKAPDTGSSISVCANRPGDSVAFQSRWHRGDHTRQKYCIRLYQGYCLFQCWQDGKRRLIAKVHEHGIVWESGIAFGDSIIDEVEHFFGVRRKDDRDFTTAEHGRIAMVHPLTVATKEKTKQQARRYRSNSRPPKWKRDRVKANTVKVWDLTNI